MSFLLSSRSSGPEYDVAVIGGGNTAAATRLSSSSSGWGVTSAAAAGFNERFSGRGAAWESNSAADSREAFWAGGLGSGMWMASFDQQKRRHRAGVYIHCRVAGVPD